MLRNHKKDHKETTTVVLPATQTTAFMGDGSQMVIPHGTVDQLHNEGISVISDLIDFDKSIIKKISSNLFCPVGRIADPDTGAAPGAAIPAPPFVFGA